MKNAKRRGDDAGVFEQFQKQFASLRRRRIGCWGRTKMAAKSGSPCLRQRLAILGGLNGRFEDLFQRRRCAKVAVSALEPPPTPTLRTPPTVKDVVGDILNSGRPAKDFAHESFDAKLIR